MKRRWIVASGTAAIILGFGTHYALLEKGAPLREEENVAQFSPPAGVKQEPGEASVHSSAASPSPDTPGPAGLKFWVECIHSNTCPTDGTADRPTGAFLDPTQGQNQQRLSLELRDLRRRTCTRGSIPSEWKTLDPRRVLETANPTGQAEYIAAARCRPELNRHRTEVVGALWKLSPESISSVIDWIDPGVAEEMAHLRRVILTFEGAVGSPSRDQLSAVFQRFQKLDAKADDVESWVKISCPRATDAPFWKREFNLRAAKLLSSAGISRGVSAYCP